MKDEDILRNNLKAVRSRLGISQQALAASAGVSRQAISSIELGQHSPSVSVALRLARVLGCGMEDLFWLDSDIPEIEAVAAAGVPVGRNLRLALARVDGRWIAHSLMGEDAVRTELVPADGEGIRLEGGPVRVKPLDEPASLAQSVVIAGCTPSFSLWARAAERWNPGLKVHWIFANSMNALHQLMQGEVHAAGVHLFNPSDGRKNADYVRELITERSTVIINLGIWEEGLAVALGNPRGINGITDLADPEIRIVNREKGAGSRQLLDVLLEDASIAPAQVGGYDHVVQGHLEIGREIASGRADAGVTTASVASVCGLDFIPLHRVQYDIVIFKEYMDEPPVRQLLGTLSHRWVRSQLSTLGGYDTTQTGEVVAEINPGKSI